MATPDTKRKSNHKVIFAPTVGTEFIIYDGTGSDTATNRYINLSSPNAKLAIIPDQNCYMTYIDGEEQEYPVRLHANQGYIDKKVSYTFSFIKIYTVVANTSIRIISWGYN